MSSLEQRLSKLESSAGQARKSIRSDEDIISSLKAGSWDGKHLDALFRVVEPGVLGAALAGSVELRRWLLDGHQADMPIAPIFAMYRLVACGQDIPQPREHDLEHWKLSLCGPIGDEKAVRRRTDLGSRMWDAEKGIAKRLFLKHGLRRLQRIVDLIVDAPEDQSEELLVRFIPNVNQTRWRQMVTVLEPLNDRLFFGGVPLVALSDDATEFHTLDKAGHEWTKPVG